MLVFLNHLVGLTQVVVGLGALELVEAHLFKRLPEVDLIGVELGDPLLQFPDFQGLNS